MLIAIKLKLALACAAGLIGPLLVAPLVMERDGGNPGLRDQQAVVELHPGSASYRVNGDFTHAGKQAAAPLVQVSLPRPLAIMKHQVSSADYQRCVDDGACRALDRGVVVAADRPAVQISWHDANGYAAWLSRKTGETWRLPTDEEWAFAAGSKFKDDGVTIDDNDPSKRWIARYEREADRAPSAPGTRTFGAFGTNENGLQDVGGNVWEWTPPASSAACSTMPARSSRKARTAACGSSRASIAPTSPTSSGTPRPADARSAFLRTTSASAWSSNRTNGPACSVSSPV